MEGGGNFSNQLLVPLKLFSTTGEEVSHKHKKRKGMPNSSFANLAAHTFITRLKIVTLASKYWKSAYEVEEDYNHLLGHCVQPASTVTWLSDLPDHLISLILSSLPLDEAVRTSILSKRWRYLWSLMPNLTLPEFASVDTITNVLKLFKNHRVGLLDFNVVEVQGRFPTRQEIDSWLSLACSRPVEDLVLRLDIFDSLKITSYPCRPRIEHWFTHDASLGFSTLKRLTLGYCMFASSTAKLLTSLEYLALERVVLDDNMIRELTSSCPMLGELKLRECNSNVPLRMSITNPKTTKLTIDEVIMGRPDSLPMLVLRAPYLTMLVIASEVGRHYKLKVPSLCTLKLANFERCMFSDQEKAALKNIFSCLDTREIYLSAVVVQGFGRCVRQGIILAPPTIKVKHLHLQVKKFPRELPGLVYFLKSCAGIETFVLDFDSINANQELNIAKHFRYLNCSTVVLEDRDQFVIKDKEKRVCLDDEDSWSSLRFLLSFQMPDLKFIVINGFKKMLRIEKACIHDSGANSCRHVVDKYEFKLLKLLLKYSLGLEKVTVRTKDVYLIEEVDDMGEDMLAIRTDKYKNIYLDGVVDKMEIPQWDKELLNLPRGSPGAKINVTSG